MSVWRIGHRGACGYAPENTLLSMQRALDLGVHGVEFDIQLSSDFEPVVIHDDSLQRTTDGKGRVEDFTLAQLQMLNAGEKEKIPSLQQVFDFVDKRCRLFIELKAAGAQEPVAELIDHYVRHKGWIYEQCFVCSFDHGQIAAIRKINPDIRTCALIAGIPISLAAIAAEVEAWSINPCIEHINQKLVDDAHKRGLRVITWTANEVHHIAKAKKLGVDGIVSNYPELI